MTSSEHLNGYGHKDENLELEQRVSDGVNFRVEVFASIKRK